ncbi:MAG TPA: M57 family metalloprotease, partial [Kofleriaceae bacterium]|nr:M57 family metalloprotease [Kofleriaceae bacterium]
MTCGALTFGCGSEPTESVDDTQEIIDNLVQAGFPRSDIMVVDGVVYTGRDAEVTLVASREMLESPAGQEQYRTTNLVSTGLRTICVNGSAFTGRLS